jgi:predicted acetyltransferase
MHVAVRAAQPQDRSLLARLLGAYLLEFDGSTEPYPYLDHYWTEPDRLPLLIDVDGEVAGFCLIRRAGDRWAIAEFSVVPELRRRGVGRAAVIAVVGLARAEGAADIEATVHADHPDALAFWLAVGFREAARIDASIVTRMPLRG